MLKHVRAFNLSLPVDRDQSNKYFKTNNNIISAIKDDFKVLLLTNKNERVMSPNFGIGFDELLFHNDINYIKSQVDSRIREQVKLYLPDVIIKKIVCLTKYDLKEEDQPQMNDGEVLIQITFNIKNITDEQLLELTMEF